MTPAEIVKIITKEGQRFTALAQAGLAGGDDSNPVRKMFRKWAARYISFTRRRFIIFSRGGGNWAELAPSTKKARKRNKRSYSILVDTGRLRDSINPAVGGMNIADVKNGVKISFADKAHPPVKGGRGAATLADIASYNHFGGGHLPARPILVTPDEDTQRGMIQDARVAAKELAKLAKD